MFVLKNSINLKSLVCNFFNFKISNIIFFYFIFKLKKFLIINLKQILFYKNFAQNFSEYFTINIYIKYKSTASKIVLSPPTLLIF